MSERLEQLRLPVVGMCCAEEAEQAEAAQSLPDVAILLNSARVLRSR